MENTFGASCQSTNSFKKHKNVRKPRILFVKNSNACPVIYLPPLRIDKNVTSNCYSNLYSFLTMFPSSNQITPLKYDWALLHWIFFHLILNSIYFQVNIGTGISFSGEFIQLLLKIIQRMLDFSLCLPLYPTDNCWYTSTSCRHFSVW